MHIDFGVSAKDLINIQYGPKDIEREVFNRVCAAYKCDDLTEMQRIKDIEREVLEKYERLDENNNTKEDVFAEYCKEDVEITKWLKSKWDEQNKNSFERIVRNRMKIKKVIFNGPCTIVLWEDGTKTIVRCDNEEFDKEKGLAMAISKKALGNTSKYYNTFKHYIKEEK